MRARGETALSRFDSLQCVRHIYRRALRSGIRVISGEGTKYEYNTGALQDKEHRTVTRFVGSRESPHMGLVGSERGKGWLGG